MSKIRLYGDTSGYLELKAPDVSPDAEVEIPASFGPYGKVLQVVWDNTNTQQTSTSTSFVDITGLSLNITPTSATSSILITVALQLGSAGPGPVARILRDATDITGGGSGSYLGFAMTESGPADSLVYQVLDSPATTSSITYKVQARCHSGGATFYVNDRSSGGFGLLSSISAMEIGA